MFNGRGSSNNRGGMDRGRSRGRGQGGENGRGRGHARGGSASVLVVPHADEVRRFLSRLSRQKFGLRDSEKLCGQIFGQFSRSALQYALSHPSECETDLEFLFSQPLFYEKPHLLLSEGNVTEKDITSATQLLHEYCHAVSPFGRDRMAFVLMDGDPRQLRRYALTFGAVQTRLGLSDFEAFDEKALTMLDRFADQVLQLHQSNAPTSEEAFIREQLALLKLFVQKQKYDRSRAEKDRLARSVNHNGGNRPAPRRQRNNNNEDEDDATYEQGYATRLQERNFLPDFQVATVEPSFLELVQDPESEAATELDEKARVITYGAPIDSFVHHLDNVFYTTRHDALLPLREGIQRLIENDFKVPKRSEGQAPMPVKVLFDLRLVCVSASCDHGALYVFYSNSLSESASKNKNIGKRRLLPGSLVVISNDKLETGEVCIVVRIEDFPPEKGFICLRLADTARTHDADGTATALLGPLKNIYATYALLESTVYWETHVHSLKAIQKLRDRNDDLFRSIRCNARPRGVHHDVVVPFKPLAEYDEEAVRSFTFDPSQQRAFNHIFSHQAPIVQGPPGTGKSYIGVTAVRTMIKERVHVGEQAPILVVCYTNHALDAFLTDLIESEPDLFDEREEENSEALTMRSRANLVRLGFRSKSEQLQKYVLPNDVRGARGHFYGARDALHQLWDAAAADNFIPKATDVGMDKMAALLTLRQDEAGQLFRRAKAEVSKAEAELGEVSNLISLDEVELVERAIKDLKVSKDASFHTIVAKLSAESSKSKIAKDAVDILNEIQYDGLDEEFICLLKHKSHKMTPVYRRRLENLQKWQTEMENAKQRFENFLTFWRDEKGKIRNQPVQDVATAPVAPVEDDEDLGDENEERFLEQRQEHDEQRRIDRDAVERIRLAAATQIRATAVLRPAFLDEPNFSPAALTPAQRYDLFHYMKDCNFRHYQPQLVDAMIRCNSGAVKFKSATNDSHASAIKRALVVGATTTGLSRYLSLLTAIGVKCVVLEEAAEIPECHSLAALLPSVTHFVQIGDHQQLRPKVASYENTKKNLHISLMERMLQLNNHCETLSVQRRMRPEIANFIRPLYKRKLEAVGLTLEDHPRVKNEYPTSASVYGLAKESGFVHYLSHNFPESASGSTQSWENKKEAQFGVALTWYINRQKPNASITLLVPYTGMLLLAQQLAKDPKYKVMLNPQIVGTSQQRNVRIVSIDDFQGEESDVVILCLTRSTRPGFLRENNRICVALSRARHLQIVIGNFACFEQCKKSFWPSVFERAKQQLPRGISKKVTLHCPTHEKSREVSIDTGLSPDAVSPLGGCQSICSLKRVCGHTCEAMCHGGVDCELVSKCSRPCARVGGECTTSCEIKRSCAHPCARLCYETCELCLVKIEAVCACGEKTTIPCHKLDRTQKTRYVECKKVHKVKMPTCKHVIEVKCSEVHTAVCTAKCGKKHDDCDHSCKSRCSDCFVPEVGCWNHGACQEACTRRLPCGHTCSSPCSNMCPPCDKPCPSRCEHHPKKCGGKDHQCGDASKCVDCREPCQNKCEHTKCTKSCFEECNRRECNEPCGKKLSCGHRCRGLCGEVCLTQCLECKPLTDEDVFFGGELEDNARFVQLQECGHLFEVGDMDHYMKEQVDFTRRSITVPVCPKCSAPIYLGAGVMRYKKLLMKARTSIRGVQGRSEDDFAKVKDALESAASRLKLLKGGLSRVPNRLEGLKLAIHGVLAFARRYDTQNFLNEKRDGAAKARDNKTINLELSMNLCLRISLVALLLRAVVGSTSQSDAPMPMPSDTAIDNGMREFACLVTNTPRTELEDCIRTTLANGLTAHGFRLSPGNPPLEDLALELSMVRKPTLTEDERRGIYNALIGGGSIVRAGAFRTCPCGYIYTIGDCGGAMQVTTCPDCQRQIGGEQHRDVTGVRHNGEFDGSTQAAWPQ